MNYAVIFAGGVGKRMTGSQIPKQFLEVNNKPIIIYTLEHFEQNELIDGIVISCVDSWIEYLKELLVKFNIKKVFSVVPGGKTGQLSIYNGIKEVKSFSKSDDDIVLIHDGVRPLIDSELITKNIITTQKFGNCITCVKVTETIVKSLNEENINQVYERDPMFIAKAPQTFYLKDIYRAHQKALKNNIINSIDSCTLMNSYNYQLHMILGDYKNIKITTPIDYFMFKAIIEAEKGETNE